MLPPRNPTLSLSLSLSLLLPTTAALAQTTAPSAPRVCTSTDPLDLVATSRSSGVDAIVAGAQPTLWVLYSAQDAQGQETASILRVGGIDGSDLMLLGSQRLGPGYVTQGGIAAAGGNVFAAYVRPDHHVAVSVRPVAGGTPPSEVLLDAPEDPIALSVAAVGDRAIVAWDDGAHGLRYAWLDARGALAGGVQTVAGHYDAPAVTPAFGGALLFRDAGDGAQRLGMLRATGDARPSVPRAAAGAAAVSSVSAGGVDGRAVAVYAARDGTHLATLSAADGTGADRVLGGADIATQTAVAATPWGAFAAWTRGGQIWFSVAGVDGTPVTDEFVVAGGGAAGRARVPAMTAFGNSAVLVWSAAGATGTGVRMVRVSCQ